MDAMVIAQKQQLDAAAQMQAAAKSSGPCDTKAFQAWYDAVQSQAPPGFTVSENGHWSYDEPTVDQMLARIPIVEPLAPDLVHALEEPDDDHTLASIAARERRLTDTLPGPRHASHGTVRRLAWEVVRERAPFVTRLSAFPDGTGRRYSVRLEWPMEDGKGWATSRPIDASCYTALFEGLASACDRAICVRDDLLTSDIPVCPICPVAVGGVCQTCREAS